LEVGVHAFEVVIERLDKVQRRVRVARERRKRARELVGMVGLDNDAVTIYADRLDDLRADEALSDRSGVFGFDPQRSRSIGEQITNRRRSAFCDETPVDHHEDRFGHALDLMQDV
jgi:hypothetical protein